ncbi:MAG: alpha/beta hydrolase-fold protein [Pseudomonadota bacterium]
MISNATYPRGTLNSYWLDSSVLQDNPLQDSTRRRIDVYIPFNHTGKDLPLLVDLVGFLSGGPAHTNWKNFGENLPERLDRLIACGVLPPVVVAFPDCFTRLGGNQYINSAGIGRWADFLIAEVVPHIEDKLGCGGSGRRGVFGKSSGGYGSITHALLYPDFWAAAACHSGDMGFEHMLGEFPGVLRALSSCDNNIQLWLENFYAKPKQGNNDLHTLMLLAMCATYDPDPTAFMHIRLPVDLYTCEVIPQRWHNFMHWDPLNIAAERASGLKQLKALFIDCGSQDQYNLVFGARRLHRLLEQKKIPHFYEEFADNHSGIDYRMDRSLPILVNALLA